MFQAPSKTTVYASPADPIDVNERYLFKLAKLEDEGVSKFADQAKGENFHNIRWHFRVALASNPTVPILTTDNDPWEHVEWTSSKTGKNPKNGMVAKARAWAEALVGHALEDEDIDDSLGDRIMDKVATGFFEEKEIIGQTGETYTRLKIMRLQPFRAKTADAPAPASAAVAAPAPAQPKAAATF